MSAGFPFPSRGQALVELKRDPCFDRIPAEDIPLILEKSWDVGMAAARQTMAGFGGETPDFFALAADKGVKVTSLDKDCVFSGTRYFSHYLSGKKQIQLYTRSIGLWAVQNGVSTAKAQQMILAHEYFHVLECTQLGLTSRRYQVPVLRLGNLTLGKTGLRTMSEIAANAFVYGCFVEENRNDQ